MLVVLVDLTELANPAEGVSVVFDDAPSSKAKSYTPIHTRGHRITILQNSSFILLLFVTQPLPAS
jgi:hypothetical protein